MAEGQAGTFTVEQVIGDLREFTSAKRGKQTSQKLQLQGRPDPVELVSDPTDPAPKDGDVIDGTIYPSGNEYPDKLYRRRKGGGGGGGRSAKDWEKSGRAAGRAAAQERALIYCQLKGKADVTWDELMKLADAFYDDAQAAQAEDYRK